MLHRSLLDTTNARFSPAVLDHLGQVHSESVARTGRAVDGLVAVVLAGLANRNRFPALDAPLYQLYSDSAFSYHPLSFSKWLLL